MKSKNKSFVLLQEVEEEEKKKIEEALMESLGDPIKQDPELQWIFGQYTLNVELTYPEDIKFVWKKKGVSNENSDM